MNQLPLPPGFIQQFFLSATAGVRERHDFGAGCTSFAQAVWTLREKLSLTQWQLANRTSLTQNVIWKIEHNQRCKILRNDPDAIAAVADNAGLFRLGEQIRKYGGFAELEYRRWKDGDPHP